MPKGYWIARVDVSDPEQYKRYVAANAEPLRKYGAHFLVRAGRSETPEGISVPQRGRAGTEVVVKARKGAFLMFPDLLKHSVDANIGEEERISVSFNLMFSSFTQQSSEPLG